MSEIRLSGNGVIYWFTAFISEPRCWGFISDGDARFDSPFKNPDGADNLRVVLLETP